MRMWEHIKLGELPRHNALGFCWGRSLKTDIEIKRKLFTLVLLHPRQTPNKDCGNFVAG
jgi:hypothetical protein